MTRLTKNLSRTAATIFAAAALAMTSHAQSLEGHVVRNPDDTVTYTVDLSGPPNGMASLFLSPWLLPRPLPFAPFGNLFLDPTVLLATPAIRLDAGGRGAVRFNIDPIRAFDVPIFFQAVFLDFTAATQPVVRLANNALGLNQRVAAPNPEGFAAAMTTGVGCDVQVWGPAGQGYTILIRDDTGRVVGQRNVVVGPTGTTGLERFAIPGMKAGYRYEVWKDIGQGHVVQVWSGTW